MTRILPHRPSPDGDRRPAHDARGVVVILIAAALLLGAHGCTGPGKSDRKDEKATAKQAGEPPRPGARQWEGAALQLPNDAPVVASARLDALLQNARGLRAWMIEQPAMFGADGESFVRRFESGWNQLASGLGADPLSERAPEKLGVDVARPIYMGLYPPAATDGRQFVEQFDTAVREALDLGDGETLAAVLDAMREGKREIPPGLHSTIADKLERLQPHAGFRVLVPVSDPASFAEQFATVAAFAEYERVDIPGLDEGADDGAAADAGRGFVNPGNRWPAVALRIDDGWAMIDALLPEPGARPLEYEGDRRRDYLREELGALIEQGGAGRPRAPRPLDDPAFAVSADQAATADFARMRAYKNALSRAARTAVDRRSVALIEGLGRASAIAHQWGTAADALTGVSYGFYGLPDSDAGRRLHTLAAGGAGH